MKLERSSRVQLFVTQTQLKAMLAREGIVVPKGQGVCIDFLPPQNHLESCREEDPRWCFYWEEIQK
jgi:hypothetical protein